MDINVISQIAAAGAMGVSILCIYKVYELLKKEQERDSPRPKFMKGIYLSMFFALLMSAATLGIEVVLFNLKSNTNSLTNDLEAIGAMNLFIADANGNPKNIEITHKGAPIQLDDNQKKTNWNISLKKDQQSPDRIKAILMHGQGERALGYISNPELIASKKELPSSHVDGLNTEDLYIIGRSYAGATIAQRHENINQNSINIYKAADHLLDIVERRTNPENKLWQKASIKILVDPTVLEELSDEDCYRIITAYSKPEFPRNRYKDYDLAQVYYTLFKNSENRELGDSIYDLHLRRLEAFYQKNCSPLQDSIFAQQCYLTAKNLGY